jgi:YidC/Oxa1 family membrane protein insertase
MDTYRAFLAIGLSFIILLGYQYFFVGPPTNGPQPADTERPAPQTVAQAPTTVAPTPAATPPSFIPALSQQAAPATPTATTREGRDITIETNLFSAVLTETGGGFKSFTLKNYRETNAPDSPPMELVQTQQAAELPAYFSWNSSSGVQEVPLYTADKTSLSVTDNQKQETLTLKSTLSSGLIITRTLVVASDDYLIDLTVDIHNPTDTPQPGTPSLYLTNQPFAASDVSRFLFSGPAVMVNDTLEETKPADLDGKTKTLSGKISWAAYEGTYFLTGVIPGDKEGQNVQLAAAGDKVSTILYPAAILVPAQATEQYKYSLYFGPKKISILKEAKADLERIINFGWFDVLARPTLLLLNFIYRYLHNYGLAIILVTIIIKTLFFPIAQKGMKSMRNMQKIQPKITKLREKYKSDPTRMNQEMMNLYKTYKINPLGGCLPMVLQIPVFFALYKVLLQAIELRHAPFMLWITDLSAPDRLWVGLNLPYLGGIPVLTLLMGGSMFLQQKMTPSPADPTQAKIMMFLPVIFTFMFLNFASGLVLYWLVNNLLSIGQQYMINKAKDA